MRKDFETWEEFFDWVRASKESLFAVCPGVGPSPGGAASELRVSRQWVYKLIEAGKLDAIFVRVDEVEKSQAVFVTQESIDRVKAEKSDKG
mgnify:CR=1 FL=1